MGKLKVPTKKERKEIEKRWQQIHEILKLDAKEQLKNDKSLRTPAEKKLLKLLLGQKEFVGNIATWLPTKKAKEKLIETGLVEPEFIQGGFSDWLADEVKRLIQGGEISRIVKIFEKFEPNIIETLEPALRNYNYIFYRTGDIWFIKFKSKWAILKDWERLHYIAYLIDRPYESIWAHELTRYVKKLEPDYDYSKMGEEKLKAITGLSISDLSSEITKKELEDLKNMADNLWYELQEAKSSKNQQKIKEAEKNWSAAKKHLANEYGLFIRASDNRLSFKVKPKLKKEAEKVRQLVHKHIKNAINDIKRELPELHHHLKDYITKGTICSYKPRKSENIDWFVRY